jgi:hypothetical protein
MPATSVATPEQPEAKAPTANTTRDVQQMFVPREALARRPIRTTRVDIPESFGGGYVKLRALKQGEREELDESALDKTFKDDGTVTVKLNNRGFQARALAMCLINEDGSAYYSDVGAGATELADMDDALFDVLFEACDKLNILTSAARKALGKDSGPTPSSSSSLTLPTSGDASSRS